MKNRKTSPALQTHPSPPYREGVISFFRLSLALTLALLLACGPTPENVQKSDALPPIYPDYADVTIPVNIAPLNFLVRGAEAVCVEAGGLTVSSRGEEVVFDEGAWRQLLKQNDSITVSVTALTGGRWTRYKSFRWYVVKDKLDPWLTYRLIEPDYEIWNNIQLKQRCIENFDEAVLTDYRLQENRCMNCHTPASQRADLSMLYVRGQGGGAILNENGQLRKLNIKTDDMASGSVYFGFSPSGRYITFSTNVIIPAFHSKKEKRLEVFDSESDVYVADLNSRPTDVTSTIAPRRCPGCPKNWTNCSMRSCACRSTSRPAASEKPPTPSMAGKQPGKESTASAIHVSRPMAAVCCSPYRTMAPSPSGTAKPTSECLT